MARSVVDGWILYSLCFYLLFFFFAWYRERLVASTLVVTPPATMVYWKIDLIWCAGGRRTIPSRRALTKPLVAQQNRGLWPPSVWPLAYVLVSLTNLIVFSHLGQLCTLRFRDSVICHVLCPRRWRILVEPNMSSPYALFARMSCTDHCDIFLCILPFDDRIRDIA